MKDTLARNLVGECLPWLHHMTYQLRIPIYLTLFYLNTNHDWRRRVTKSIVDLSTQQNWSDLLMNASSEPRMQYREASTPQNTDTLILDKSVTSCRSWHSPLVPHHLALFTTLPLLALPVPGSEVIDAFTFGESLWGKTARIIARLPSGEAENYFLKVLTIGVINSSFHLYLRWQGSFRLSPLAKSADTCARESLNHSALSMAFLLVLFQNLMGGEDTTSQVQRLTSCWWNFEVLPNRYGLPFWKRWRWLSTRKIPPHSRIFNTKIMSSLQSPPNSLRRLQTCTKDLYLRLGNSAFISQLVMLELSKRWIHGRILGVHYTQSILSTS